MLTNYNNLPSDAIPDRIRAVRLGVSNSGIAGAAPWPNTIIAWSKRVPVYPLRRFPTRWQWFLRYSANGKQVQIGDAVSTGTVQDIRLGGRILVGDTWRSPSEIGARWIEHRDGQVVHVYGRRT